MNIIQEQIISYLSRKAIAAGSIAKLIFNLYDFDIVLENISGSLVDIKNAVIELSTMSFVDYSATANKSGIIKLTPNGFEYHCEEISKTRIGFQNIH